MFNISKIFRMDKNKIQNSKMKVNSKNSLSTIIFELLKKYKKWMVQYFLNDLNLNGLQFYMKIIFLRFKQDYVKFEKLKIAISCQSLKIEFKK